ncbi:MAG TPA: BsuPI-related putative proteinase inhibitor [Gammaproteobacteria bacterium]|jgi:hypothetical protein|nr:BsuPI-related putative proteinase inhibitor [Gammaproteobacteria bacterium]
MRLLIRLLLGATALLLLLGNSNCSQTSNNASDAPQFVTNIEIEDGNGNLVSSGTTPPSFVTGTNIEFTVNVRNRSTTRQTLWFNTSEQSNFAVVEQGTADVVWNSDNGQSPTTGFTSITLTPGQSQNVTFTWNQKDDSSNQLAVGSYEVLGGFTVYNTAGAGSAAANGDSMAEGQPTAAQMFPSIYRSILLPFTIIQ